MDKEKVIKAMEHCKKYGSLGGNDCNGHYEYTDNLQEIIKANNHRKDCPYGKCKTGCVVTLVADAITLLKNQDEQLRKMQKDKDRLCLEVSEWKHKFHDVPLKEQEAVEPYSMNAERTYGICPKCGKIVFRYGNVEENHYCGICGQEVKWK